MHQSTLFFSLPLSLPFKNPAVGTLRFHGFFHCVWRPCGCRDFDGILRFFPCGWASMCGDFEILRVFSLCVGPLCLEPLRFYVFLPVCAAPVSGDFEILRFFLLVCGASVCEDFARLRFFPLYVGPLCVWGL